MCLSAGEVNPLCDDCFAKSEEKGENFKDEDMCPECKELMKRYCWCCMKTYKTAEEAKIVDGSCAKCREE